MIRVAVFLTALLFSTAPIAQTLGECDWRSSLRNIGEPWEDYTRTFASGAIRITATDTGGEPVCCSQHLVIQAPHPEWFDSCAVLSGNQDLGFLDVYFEDITASYDPAKGLLLAVPVGYYDPENEYTDPDLFETIYVRINQSTGSIAIETP